MYYILLYYILYIIYYIYYIYIYMYIDSLKRVFEQTELKYNWF